MSGCDAFEIAIEKRRLKALDEEEAARLDRHLASCDACRHYARMAGRTEDVMQTITRDALDGVDWDRVGSRVHKMARQYSRGWVRMVLMLVVLVPLIGSLAGWGALVGATILGIALSTIRVWVGRARALDAARSEETQSDLMRFYRLELDRRIASIRRANVVEFGMGTFLTVLAGVQYFGLSPATAPTRFVVLQAILGGALLALGLYRRLVQLPRMRSERSQIS